MDSAQMPRNGSGVFSLASGYEATDGQTAEASQHNLPLEDIAQDLNAARPIVAGGTGATTASGARTNLAVPGTAADDTITGDWTISGDWTITGTWDMSGSTLTLPDDVVTLGKIADAALSGSDATLITGTAGTNGNLAQWNGDGDLVDGPDVLDEDDMASDSDGAVPTQQSVKAYVTARRTRETALTTSGAAEYGFTGIVAGANRITVMFSAVSGAGTDDFLIQIGDSGGYETTGYSAASAYVSGSGNDVFSSTAGFPINTVNSASTVLSGAVVLTRIDGNTWVASGVLHDSNVPGTPTVTGTKTLSAELDRIRLKTSGSDNFDGGTLNIIVET
jgi:hypothetical protein